MSRAVHDLFVCLVVVAAITLFPILAAGQSKKMAPAEPYIADEMPTVENWNPNYFEFACGDETGPFRPDPRELSCGDGFHQTRIDFEVFSRIAAEDFQVTGFASPHHLGPVIDSFSGSGQAVRIFNRDYGAAAVRHLPSPGVHACDREGYRLMELNPAIGRRLRRTEFIAQLAAHELFHAVTAAIPGLLQKNETRRKGCYLPRWISEAMPDAVAIDFTRREFPNSSPPRRGEFENKRAGLRPYFVPLNEEFPEDSGRAYRTSSFWLFLGDKYHDQDLKFLQDYLAIPAPRYAGDKEDWLHWLDDRSKEDPRIEMPLYLVYPAFLTSFSGEWAKFGVGKGGVGRNIGRRKWVGYAFGECKSATISLTEPYKEIDIEIEPVAGMCLSVKIKGLRANDLAWVKVGALTEYLDLADSLHLGLAFSNDRTRFNCAEYNMTHRPGPGSAHCIIEPVTGTLASGADGISGWSDWGAARMWHASSIESGGGAQSKGGGGGHIENVYILSYVPTKPWQALLEPNMSLASTDSSQPRSKTARIGIGLEWSRLSVDGKSVNKGAASGTRSRSAAALGGNPLEGDQLYPSYAGWVDPGPVEAMLGEGIAEIVGETFKMIGSANDLPLTAGDVSYNTSYIAFGEVEVRPVDVVGETVKVKRRFSVAVPEELPEGKTGTFHGVLIGQIEERSDLLYMSVEDELATVSVTENSRDIFRATVDGKVCEVHYSDLVAGKARCRRKLSVFGEIIKPFLYLYRPGTALTSVESEGEKLYNTYRFDRSRRALALDGGPGAPGAKGGGGGGSAGTGAAQAGCDCSCAARASRPQCADRCSTAWAACEATDSPATEQRKQALKPARAKPTVEAQRKWFSRLIGRHGLPPEVAEMLVDDFATMSEETRAYLIRRYRGRLH